MGLLKVRIAVIEMKPRSFYFHYNKPQSQRTGHPVISVHISGVCHFVKNIKCTVPTQGRLSARQPRFVMHGKCKTFEIVDDVAYVG